VANYQGELLNRIGQMNIDHLKAALDDDALKCREIMESQLRTCFLGPISGAAGGNRTYPYGGFSAGDRAARENGGLVFDPDCEDIRKWYKNHVREIRQLYATNPKSYPEPWEGAWEEYAHALDLVLGDGIGSLYALPANINFIDAKGGHILLDPLFYDAVATRCWCWFKFCAPGLLESYSSVADWGPLPFSDLETRARRCVNSEFYSLNLRVRTGRAVDLLGTNLICRLTGATEAEVADSDLIADAEQEWMFYDEADAWHDWWEIRQPFPVVGDVRREYDVRGCAALCQVHCVGANLLDGGEWNGFTWTAGAKPFGSVEDEDGRLAVVTACKNFVTPAFDQVRLVPIDAVGGSEVCTADADWLDHVHSHLPVYLEGGAPAIGAKDCWYCQRLVTWEHRSFRKTGAIWLKYHSAECERYSPGGHCSGGAPHAH